MSATTVEEYLDRLPPASRAAVEEVRRRVRALAPHTGEAISYAMLAVTVAGRPVFHVGGWKRHVGIYPVPRFDGPLEDAVAPYRAATDTLRLPLDLPLPDVLELVVPALLERAA